MLIVINCFIQYSNHMCFFLEKSQFKLKSEKKLPEYLIKKMCDWNKDVPGEYFFKKE